MMEFATYYMSQLNSTFVLAAISCVTLTLWWWRQKPHNAPPGPLGLPFIGSMIPFIKSLKNRDYLEYISRLHQKYGPIISLKVGVQRFIHIDDGSVINHLFQKEELATRPLDTFPVFEKLCHGSPRGLTFGNGAPQAEMRKFFTQTMRDFGIGQDNIDEMIQSEVSIFCRHLEGLDESNQDALSDVKINLQLVTTNIVHQILFGHRKEYDDPGYKNLIQQLHEFSDNNLLAFPENYIPGLESIPLLNQCIPMRKGGKFDGLYATLESYVNAQIEEHRSSYTPGEIRDFTDLYIKYEEEKKDFYTNENIFGLMVDLIRVGSDIPASAMSWAVLFLARNPTLQKELREEIEQVVGESQFQRRDKPQLVKIQAFINEIYRYVTVVPIPGPHTTTKPISVEGYTLLPGDVIFASLYTMHHDKSYWKDPEVFRIERWFDDKGSLLKHEGYFYPFSVGRRSCVGRQLANTEFLLVLVQLLQNFIIEDKEDSLQRSEKQKSGIIRTPNKLLLRLKKYC